MFRRQAVPSCRFQCNQKHSIRYGSTRLWSSSMPSSRYLGSCVLERRRLEVTQACLAFDLFSQLFWLSNFFSLLPFCSFRSQPLDIESTIIKFPLKSAVITTPCLPSCGTMAETVVSSCIFSMYPPPSQQVDLQP